jgi:predicted ArsR family transcriptional regulator
VAQDSNPIEGQDLFATTRGRLLALLCRGPRTVNELAADLGLTDNAVRAQLERLQRSGLVHQVGLRPGTRKPHVDYALTPDARRAFPKAYEPVLKALVNVLAERLPRDQTAALFKEVAARVLRDRLGTVDARDPSGRLAQVLEKLGDHAAGVEVEAAGDVTTLRACGCPLASVTAAHPALCEVLAGVLGDVLGARVRERCDREGVPRCRFEVSGEGQTDQA